MELRQRALQLLLLRDPAVKAAAVREWAATITPHSAIDSDAVIDIASLADSPVATPVAPMPAV